MDFLLGPMGASRPTSFGCLTQVQPHVPGHPVTVVVAAGEVSFGITKWGLVLVAVVVLAAARAALEPREVAAMHPSAC